MAQGFTQDLGSYSPGGGAVNPGAGAAFMGLVGAFQAMEEDRNRKFQADLAIANAMAQKGRLGPMVDPSRQTPAFEGLSNQPLGFFNQPALTPESLYKQEQANYYRARTLNELNKSPLGIADALKKDDFWLMDYQGLLYGNKVPSGLEKEYKNMTHGERVMDFMTRPDRVERQMVLEQEEFRSKMDSLRAKRAKNLETLLKANETTAKPAGSKEASKQTNFLTGARKNAAAAVARSKAIAWLKAKEQQVTERRIQAVIERFGF